MDQAQGVSMSHQLLCICMHVVGIIRICTCFTYGTSATVPACPIAPTHPSLRPAPVVHLEPILAASGSIWGQPHEAFKASFFEPDSAAESPRVAGLEIYLQIFSAACRYCKHLLVGAGRSPCRHLPMETGYLWHRRKFAHMGIQRTPRKRCVSRCRSTSEALGNSTACKGPAPVVT